MNDTPETLSLESEPMARIVPSGGVGPTALLASFLIECAKVFPLSRIKGTHHITLSERGPVVNVWVEELNRVYSADFDGIDWNAPLPWIEKLRADIFALANAQVHGHGGNVAQ